MAGEGAGNYAKGSPFVESHYSLASDDSVRTVVAVVVEDNGIDPLLKSY